MIPVYNKDNVHQYCMFKQIQWLYYRHCSILNRLTFKPCFNSSSGEMHAAKPGVKHPIWRCQFVLVTILLLKALLLHCFVWFFCYRMSGLCCCPHCFGQSRATLCRINCQLVSNCRVLWLLTCQYVFVFVVSLFILSHLHQPLALC